MFNKKSLIYAIVTVFVIILIIVMFLQMKGNGNSQKDEISKISNIPQYKFGLITGLGGLGDKSFNDMQYNGMIMAKKRYNIDFEYVAPQYERDLAPAFREIINKNCNVIFAASTDVNSILLEFAEKYPERKFILLDVPIETNLPNIASISFKQNEGSFLVGALSALMTKTNNIAMIGGRKIEVLEDFYVGFESGAKYINPKINVKAKYLGDMNPNIDPWSDAQFAKKVSLDLINKDKCDILYGVAAGANLGVFVAASEKKCYAIGVDSNQDDLAKGTILTSMMKRLDESILFLIGMILDNKFEGKPYLLGFTEGGVSLSPMEYTKNIIGQEKIRELEEIKEKIINNEIKVPTVY